MAVDTGTAADEVIIAEVVDTEVSGTVVEILLQCTCLSTLLANKRKLLPFPFFYTCYSFSSYGCIYFACVCVVAFHSS